MTKKVEYIGYGQTASGQYVAVRGAHAQCIEYARANPGKSCHIRKAIA